eukprot:GHRR01036003.1.p1 GENE.GHRR01036003.1~~GHRR01036003.1.p1  ORF type:complete len:124 (+),score=28.78 GHRR01036003.1:304-675(+)
MLIPHSESSHSFASCGTCLLAAVSRHPKDPAPACVLPGGCKTPCAPQRLLEQGPDQVTAALCCCHQPGTSAPAQHLAAEPAQHHNKVTRLQGGSILMYTNQSNLPLHEVPLNMSGGQHHMHRQ